MNDYNLILPYYITYTAIKWPTMSAQAQAQFSKRKGQCRN